MQNYLALFLMTICKALLLWICAQMFFALKKNPLSKAILICFLSFFPLPLLQSAVTVNELGQKIFMYGNWILPVVLPLLLIKILYRIKILLACLPVFLFILVDFFLKRHLYTFIYLHCNF
ncbi:MAG: hypothetical protein JXB60_07355 [Candidatus Cloacimonetes bacterium]|nr:hypothetical protein [Candidatus Cloacimonadota bacterium]